MQRKIFSIHLSVWIKINFEWIWENGKRKRDHGQDGQDYNWK